MVPVGSTSAKVNLYAPEGFVVFKRSRVEFQSLASQVSSMRAGCFERVAWVSSKTLCTARTTQRGQGGVVERDNDLNLDNCSGRANASCTQI